MICLIKTIKRKIRKPRGINIAMKFPWNCNEIKRCFFILLWPTHFILWLYEDQAHPVMTSQERMKSLYQICHSKVWSRYSAMIFRCLSSFSLLTGDISGFTKLQQLLLIVHSHLVIDRDQSNVFGTADFNSLVIFRREPILLEVVFLNVARLKMFCGCKKIHQTSPCD